MSVEQICIVLIGLITCVSALDYVFTLQEEGATPCPDSEDIFIDAYFDLSNIEWMQIDDETIMIRGYVIFLQKVDPSLHFHMQVQKLSSGRWIETAFQIDRPDVCMTLFDKYEIWYDFIKELEANSNLCPPKPGTKYEFHDKKLSTVVRDLTPGMEGTYRSLLKVFVAEKKVFCMIVEGDLVRKFGNDKVI
ncbi:uncharacterized protein LOC129942583 [Eupeodes corollae]|uniref:uncharacterized protein LOC129942583 n=1 Tax=Eupeodes corollae TaxID=290404 RepID=UPI0024916B73|nr:uncharacterized protein LOC129942583 [Eupeodes corollae]